MNEVAELPQTVRSIAKSFGGVTGRSGEGASKVALNLGQDKVMLRYKEGKAPKDNPAEYFKSQYYLHQILQTLFPDNFPHVSLATGENAVVVDRVPDTPDFIEGKRIRKIINEQGYNRLSGEEKTWVNNKREEIKTRGNFQKTYEFLADNFVTSVYNDPDELASPWNSVVVNGNLVLLDLFDPEVRDNPTLDKTSFESFFVDPKTTAKYSGKELERIRNFYGRYEENIKKYLSAKK